MESNRPGCLVPTVRTVRELRHCSVPQFVSCSSGPLPLGVCIIGGYALSFLGWNDSWIPTEYAAFVTALVLAQGFLLPDRNAGLREFFWVSLFLVLTTPLLQFGPIRLDHYNFYTLGGSCRHPDALHAGPSFQPVARVRRWAAVSASMGMAALQRWRQQRPRQGSLGSIATRHFRVCRCLRHNKYIGVDTVGRPATGIGCCLCRIAGST